MVTRSRVRRDRRRTRAHERGVSAVEAALMTPLVLLSFFGLIEGSVLLHSNMTVGETVGSGARVGAIARSETDADWQILEEIRTSSPWFDQTSIERIVIWQATSTEEQPPVACTVGPVVSNDALDCSVYGPADLGQPPWALTCGYCPAERDAGELLGVWVKFAHGSFSGLLNNVTFTERHVLPIEHDL